MTMISNVHMPLSMPQSHDQGHTKLKDFTEIMVSNSNNDLPLEAVTSARLDGRRPDIPDIEVGKTVSLCMFL